MPKTRHARVLLLLADGFDEAAVSIVLTELRQAGLAVSLVGLRSRPVNGAHGLVVVPNTSLDRVLEVSSPILALILPEGTGHLARLRVDPRVSNLLQKSIAEDAMLIGLGNQATKMILDLTEIDGEAIRITEPEAGMYLQDFARTLAQRLVGVVEGSFV
jgi:hypothetical protein